MPNELLLGLRVLVLEDEALAAMSLEAILAGAGCVVVGPLSRVAKADQAARSEPLDAALLDVRVGDEKAFPVADTLAARRVPFIFLTGYGPEGMPARFKDCPCLLKPFRPERVLLAIAETVEARRSPPGPAGEDRA